MTSEMLLRKRDKRRRIGLITLHQDRNVDPTRWPFRYVVYRRDVRRTLPARLHALAGSFAKASLNCEAEKVAFRE